MLYIYEVEMVNPDDKIEIEIEAQDANSRDAFFKKFLNDKDDPFFVDKKVNKTYSKRYIYSYSLKENTLKGE